MAARDELFAAESADTQETRYLSDAGSANTLNADVLGNSASSSLGYNSIYYNNNQLQRQQLQQQLRRQQLLRQQQQLGYMTGTGLLNNQMQQRMMLSGNR